MINNISQAMAVIQDHTMQLLCQATGNPMPQLNWFKDGHAVSASKYPSLAIGKSILQLDNVTLSDEGNYSCVASNIVGNTSRSVYVTVLGKFLRYIKINNCYNLLRLNI